MTSVRSSLIRAVLVPACLLGGPDAAALAGRPPLEHTHGCPVEVIGVSTDIVRVERFVGVPFGAIPTLGSEPPVGMPREGRRRSTCLAAA
jgi:hypothetical protein